MPKCKLCESEIYDSYLSPDGFCKQCVDNHAIALRTPPLRPRIPCARCQGRSFVRGLQIRERATTEGSVGHQYVAPLAVTYAHSTRLTAFRGREVHEVDLNAPIGVFEVYVCRQCGFTEFYTRDADKIPVGPEYATELFETSAEGGPYREQG